jgi:hypothetical protein
MTLCTSEYHVWARVGWQGNPDPGDPCRCGMLLFYAAGPVSAAGTGRCPRCGRPIDDHTDGLTRCPAK